MGAHPPRPRRRRSGPARPATQRKAGNVDAVADRAHLRRGEREAPLVDRQHPRPRPRRTARFRAAGSSAIACTRAEAERGVGVQAARRAPRRSATCAPGQRSGPAQCELRCQREKDEPGSPRSACVGAPNEIRTRQFGGAALPVSRASLRGPSTSSTRAARAPRSSRRPCRAPGEPDRSACVTNTIRLIAYTVHELAHFKLRTGRASAANGRGSRPRPAVEPFPEPERSPRAPARDRPRSSRGTPQGPKRARRSTPSSTMSGMPIRRGRSDDGVARAGYPDRPSRRAAPRRTTGARAGSTPRRAPGRRRRARPASASNPSDAAAAATSALD